MRVLCFRLLIGPYAFRSQLNDSRSVRVGPLNFYDSSTKGARQVYCTRPGNRGAKVVACTVVPNTTQKGGQQVSARRVSIAAGIPCRVPSPTWASCHLSSQSV